MRKRVLLADDHPAMLWALKSIIQAQAHFEVIGEASNGEACLEITKTLQPDIVVLDIDMPKVDGLDVIRRLSIQAPHIRILVVSSLDAKSMAIACAAQVGMVLSTKQLTQTSSWLPALQFHRDIHFSKRLKMANLLTAMKKKYPRSHLENFKFLNIWHLALATTTYQSFYISAAKLYQLINTGYTKKLASTILRI